MRFLPLLVALVALCASLSVEAQSPAPLRHDEETGLWRDLHLRRTGDGPVREIEMRVDVEYRYRSGTLLGEPVVLCSARLSNPRGHVNLAVGDEMHRLPIGAANANLVAV